MEARTMLSMPRLVRLAESDQYDRLLEEVLRNGRPLPLAARLRLSAAGALAVSAISLALSRMTELTHRPTAGAQLLADKLLALQNDDGSFGSPAVTASAVEACIALLEQNKYVANGLAPEFRDRLEIAAERALHSLYLQREAANANQQARGLIGDALETALTLWRLGERALFEGVIGVSSLRRALAEEQEKTGIPDIESVLALTPTPTLTPIAA